MTPTRARQAIPSPFLERLAELRRWLSWAWVDAGRVFSASPLDAGTWELFEAVADREITPRAGVALAFDRGIPWDSEHLQHLLVLECRNARAASGELRPWFRALWNEARMTYAEIDPDQTTVRLWIASSPAALGIGAEPRRGPQPIDEAPSFTAGGAYPGHVIVRGLGEPSLVPWTGQPVPGAYGAPSSILQLPLRELFPGVRGQEPLELPRAVQRVRRHPAGRALLEGKLDGFPGAAGQTPVELWRWLVRLVREACDRDERLALELLSETPFGRTRPLEEIASDIRAGISEASSAELPPELRPPARRALEAPAPEDAQGRPGTPSTPNAPKRAAAAPSWRIAPVQELPPALELHELFAGLLPARGLARLFGDSGAGKSTLAVAIAAHAALGLPLGPHACMRRGVVGYVVNEGHHGFGLRWRAMAQDLGPERAAAAPILRIDGPVALSHGGTVRAFGEQLLEAAKRWSSESRPFSLLIIDTQVGSLGDLCENANDQMQRFAHNLLELGAQIGGLVLLIHHAHRAGGRARGASAIENAVDAQLWLELRGRRRILRQTKARDGEVRETGLPIGLRLIELGTDPTGSPVRTVLAEIGAPERDTSDAPERLLGIEGFLSRANGTGRELLEWFARAGSEGSTISRRDLAAHLNLPDGTLKALLEAAVRLELLEADPPRRGIPQRRAVTPLGFQVLGRGAAGADGLGSPSIPKG